VARADRNPILGHRNFNFCTVQGANGTGARGCPSGTVAVRCRATDCTRLSDDGAASAAYNVVTYDFTIGIGLAEEVIRSGYSWFGASGTRAYMANGQKRGKDNNSRVWEIAHLR
jgi:hypothetical protein